MRKIILVLLLTSCWGNDLIIPPKKELSEEYYWYYNSELFAQKDSCYIVGTLTNEFSTNKIYINRKCSIYNDTIYVVKKNTTNNIFNGTIYIDRKPYILTIKLS